MKVKFFFSLLFFILSFNLLFGQGKVNPNYHYVKSYTRKDGTFVQGHYRTNPNSTNRDNYSTLGNTNPHTGKPGWVPPDNKSNDNYNGSYPYVNAPQATVNYVPLNDFTPSLSVDKARSKISSSNSPTHSTKHNEYLYNYESGQRIINHYDGKEVFNVKTVSIIKYFKNSTYYYYVPEKNEVAFSKGQAFGQLLNGKYSMILDDGTTILETNFKEGILHGVYIKYDSTGHELSRAIYNDGEMVNYKVVNDSGELVEWLGKPYSPKSVRTFTKNRITTSKEEYISKENFKVITFNDANGKPASEFNVVNGQISGVYKSYHDDGKTISRIGYTTNGEFNGEVKDYDENQSLIALTTYMNGSKNGHFERYAKDGKVIERGSFKNDLLDGKIYFVEPNNHNYYEIIEFELGERQGNYEKRRGNDRANALKSY